MFHFSIIMIWLLSSVACLMLLIKNNFLLFFIALELIVLAINLNFVFFSLSTETSLGLYISVLLLALAAIDTAIGLSLLIKYFNQSAIGEIKLSKLVFLKA
jgi:NADH-quinone oxidoreductase subunit K